MKRCLAWFGLIRKFDHLIGDEFIVVGALQSMNSLMTQAMTIVPNHAIVLEFSLFVQKVTLDDVINCSAIVNQESAQLLFDGIFKSGGR